MKGKDAYWNHNTAVPNASIRMISFEVYETLPASLDVIVFVDSPPH